MSGDEPIAGYYSAALTRGGVNVPIRIWFGAPEMDDEILDRSHRWNVEVDGRTYRLQDGLPELLDVYRFWPWCGRNKITEATYRYMKDHSYWAKHHAPEHPKAQPHQAIDWNKQKPIF